MKDIIDKLEEKKQVLKVDGTPKDRYLNGVLDGLSIAIEMIQEAQDDRDN